MYQISIFNDRVEYRCTFSTEYIVEVEIHKRSANSIAMYRVFDELSDLKNRALTSRGDFGVQATQFNAERGRPLLRVMRIRYPRYFRRLDAGAGKDRFTVYSQLCQSEIPLCIQINKKNHWYSTVVYR